MVISLFLCKGTKMNTSPIVLSPSQIMRLAVFFRKSPSQIRKKFDGKLYNLFTRSDEKYLLMNGYRAYSDSNFYYKDEKSAIYIQYTNSYTYYQIYLMLEGLEEQINDIKTYIHHNDQIIESVKGHFESVESAYNSILARLSSRKEYSPFNYEEIRKITKQMKIGFTLDEYSSYGKVMKFDLGKIVCGDDKEGYINYQNISVWLDKKMTLLKMGFDFRKWRYETNWKYLSNIHPHVNGNSLCYGNRKEDVAFYKVNNEWGLMLATYRECFTSYYPTSSYCKIKDIAGMLRFMNKHSEEIEYPSDVITDEAKSRWYYNFIKRQAKRCRHCDNSYFTEECDNEDCIGNPATEKLCPCCDTKMIWYAHSHSLKCPTCYECKHCNVITPNSDHCKNVECSASPLYQPPCDYCNGKIVEGYCTNDNCTNGKRFIEGLIKFKTPSVCILCGAPLLRHSNGYYDCPSHSFGYHYNSYGQNVMDKRKAYFQNDLSTRHNYMSTHNNTLPCPKCHSSSLVRIDEENNLICRCSSEPLGTLGTITFNGVSFNKIIWKGEIPYGTELEELSQ